MILDTTIDEIKNSHFNNIYYSLIKKMAKTTPFDENEVKCILMVYHKYVLAQPHGRRRKTMRTYQFTNFCELVFNIRNEMIIERILKTIAKDSRTGITPEQWVKLFSIYMKCSIEDQMDFCFSIYDIEESNKLTIFVLKKFLDKNTFVDEDEDSEGIVDELIDLIIRRMDKDRDGMISKKDYVQSVRETPALMEFLGQCIPDRDSLVKAAHCCNIMSVLINAQM